MRLFVYNRIKSNYKRAKTYISTSQPAVAVKSNDRPISPRYLIPHGAAVAEGNV